ncbi:MAG: adenosine deaminase [Oscillospiraceae bacterium]|nr:adenosine deaminase [Oscillospiraceae bacterium]
MNEFNFASLHGCMTDLHLHLDGSLSVKCVRKLAHEQNITVADEDSELKKLLCAPDNCSSLNDYLRAFDFPLTLLQRDHALSDAVFTLCSELEAQGLAYAEIRFAPQLHTKLGLTQDEAVKAAIDGLRRSRFDANLILCCMRGSSDEANLQTVHVAQNYLGSGVAAIDLAGAEALFPTLDYKNVFELAAGLDIPFTIHAGEAAGPDSVSDAVAFGASRIGHGIHITDSPELMALLRDRGICLEMCPTSNIQTHACDSFDSYPIKSFLDAGICVTVNTDNMSVSDTTESDELKCVYEKCGLTYDDIKQVLINSAQSSFADEKIKKRIIGNIYRI